MTEIRLDSGERAQVLETDGDRVVVQSTAAAPYGSTLEGTIVGEDGPIRIKVRGCRCVEQSSRSHFRIEGRFVNLGKTQRELLVRPRD